MVFLELPKILPCQVMLSGYRSALHGRLLADWCKMELQVMNQTEPAPRNSG